MIFSDRIRRILTLLLDAPESEWQSIDSLAANLQVSRRTIFREISGLDSQLSSLQIALESKPGKGIRLNGDANARRQLREALRTSDIPYRDRSECRKLLLYELLNQNQEHKLIYYASQFQVSEATISHDIESLRDWLAKYNLRAGRSGMIHGSEQDKRRAMSEIIRDQIETGPIEYLSHSALLGKVFEASSAQGIMGLLDQDILHRVLDVFETSQHELGLDRYEQSSYIGLIIHLVIALERIQNGDPLPESFAASEETPSARELASLLETEFDVEFPETEISFIAIHLAAAKASSSEGHTAFEESEAGQLAVRIACAYGEPVSSLLLEDPQFLQGLITHLEPTLVRLRRHMPISNPMIDALKAEYKDLFEETRKVCSLIEEATGYPVSDEEAGFITMHVGASLERNRQKRRPVMLKAGIVCASGIGSSALLAARVAGAFHGQLSVHTLSLDQAKYADDLDLLISNFEFENASIPTVRVSTLLDAADLKAIAKTIGTIRNGSGRVRNKESFKTRMERLNRWSAACEKLISSFSLRTVPATSKPEDLVSIAADISASPGEPTKQAILRREALGPVVDHDAGFGLLHAADEAITQAEYFVLVPDQKCFTCKQLENVRFMAISLLPKPAERMEQELLSALNAALIDDEAYLEALFSKDETLAEEAIIRILESTEHSIGRNGG